MTITHVGSHIIYGDIPQRNRKGMEKYFEKHSGCKPKDYMVDHLARIAPLVVVPTFAIGLVLGSIFNSPAIALVFATIAVAVLGIIALYKATTTKYFNDDHVICISEGNSTRHSFAKWSGFSTPWSDYVNACVSYKSQTAKLPEGMFVEDGDFYKIAVDVFSVFREKAELSKVIDRHAMSSDFRELIELTTALNTFSDRCSKIVHKTHQAQQKEFMKSVTSNVDKLNSNAEIKLQAIGELDNPANISKKLINKAKQAAYDKECNADVHFKGTC